jgi:hypothetical protein
MHCVDRAPFDASQQHVPCLAHVLNLAVQALLDNLGAGALENDESFDVDVDDDEEGFIRSSIGGDVCDHDEDDLDDTSTGNILGVKITLSEEQKVMKRALPKLRSGIVKIR